MAVGIACGRKALIQLINLILILTAILGDGCLIEDLELAGANLIYIWDDNGISIDGH